MQSLLTYVSFILMALGALGLPTQTDAAINNTTAKARSTPGKPYYELGLSTPICVPTTGTDLCTTTIVGKNDTDQAWVWLFDYKCNNWYSDSVASWNSLGQGTYQISSSQLSAPASVHSNKGQFMENVINDDFWVEKSGWQQNWNGDSRYWKNDWAVGVSQNGYELKRMVWICIEWNE
ncbi:hypothetical protein EG329_005603 [Mollisiaceae sp. DMI_Dod_QoI]|nr:hypothetical protein EG329_005603 [Helotiales sp. DMI_Dod_QoI]